MVPMFDFSAEIYMCGRDFTLVRRPRAKLVNGRKRNLAPLPDETIRGSLQNPGSRELQFLPEGQRAEEIRSFYTPHKLKLGEVGDDYESDQICDQDTGNVFEVYAKRDWSSDGKYYRYLLRKVGQ